MQTFTTAGGHCIYTNQKLNNFPENWGMGPRPLTTNLTMLTGLNLKVCLFISLVYA